MNISKPDLPHPAAPSENIFLACTHTTPHIQSDTKLCRPCLLGRMQFPTLVVRPLLLLGPGRHFSTWLLPTLHCLPIHCMLQPEQHFKQTNLIISLIRLKSVSGFPWPRKKFKFFSVVWLAKSLSFSLSLTDVCVPACVSVHPPEPTHMLLSLSRMFPPSPCSLLLGSSGSSCEFSCLCCRQVMGLTLGCEHLLVLVFPRLCLTQGN